MWLQLKWNGKGYGRDDILLISTISFNQFYRKWNKTECFSITTQFKTNEKYWNKSSFPLEIEYPFFSIVIHVQSYIKLMVKPSYWIESNTMWSWNGIIKGSVAVTDDTIQIETRQIRLMQCQDTSIYLCLHRNLNAVSSSQDQNKWAKYHLRMKRNSWN